MKDKIKGTILSLGADVCGIANIDRFSQAPSGFHPTDLYSGCKSVIAFGLSIPKGLLQISSTMVYGHFNDACCPEVDLIALRAAKIIEDTFGGYAVPIPCDGPYEYWNTEAMEGRGLLSVKHAAVAAGLGTLGKNTLLLNESYGNLLTIGMILTDLELLSDPLVESICIDGCSLCIQSCPSQALNGTSAIQKKCRTSTYKKNARGFDVVYCNTCRAVCPRKYGTSPVRLPVLPDDRQFME